MTCDEIFKRVEAMPPQEVARGYSLAGVPGVLPFGELVIVAGAGRFGELCRIISAALISTSSAADKDAPLEFIDLGEDDKAWLELPYPPVDDEPEEPEAFDPRDNRYKWPEDRR